MNDEFAPTAVLSSTLLMVTLVPLVTGAVAVSVKVRSTYAAEPLMAVPLVVVVPAIEVQVVLS